MTAERECLVYIQMPGSLDIVTSGRLTLTPPARAGRTGRFVYASDYRSRPDAVPLDPIHLPLAPTPYETAKLGGVFGALGDAAPDAWGRFVIEQMLGTRNLTEVDYLLESPDDRAGALTFGRDAIPRTPGREINRVDRLSDLRAATRIIESGDLTPSVRERLFRAVDPATSMGGSRPKNTVEDDSGQWLAKFPARGDRWSNAAVEAAMLTLAARCDIRVPAVRIERLDTESILLVRRFDRERVDGGYHRHRMVSALTMLDSEAERPADADNWSYLVLADELQRWSSRPRQDQAELFRRMAFNALITNNDDHARNHAVVAAGPEWRLSPAYDLTPNPQEGVQERSLTLVCGLYGRVARRENLVSGAPRFGLSHEEANVVIDRMRDVIARHWRADVLAHGSTEQDCTRIELAFLPAGFEHPIAPT